MPAPPPLDESLCLALCHRRGLRHDSLVRNRPALADLYQVLRLDHRLTVCLRRLCLLYRGHFSWSLPVLVGAPLAARALALLLSTLDKCRFFCVVYRPRERLDE